MMAHFNPRTREGCDTAESHHERMQSNFNPRTREGCDQTVLAVLAMLLIFQSTHP